MPIDLPEDRGTAEKATNANNVELRESILTPSHLVNIRYRK